MAPGGSDVDGVDLIYTYDTRWIFIRLVMKLFSLILCGASERVVFRKESEPIGPLILQRQVR
jgi:hypothetical protein